VGTTGWRGLPVVGGVPWWTGRRRHCFEDAVGSLYTAASDFSGVRRNSMIYMWISLAQWACTAFA